MTNTTAAATATIRELQLANWKANHSLFEQVEWENIIESNIESLELVVR